jgi:hypothetical protein
MIRWGSVARFLVVVGTIAAFAVASGAGQRWGMF